jgi:hypothetical protein
MRPALIEQDAKTAPLFDAKGESLGFNLGAWLGVKGVVIIGPLPDGNATIFAQLTHLRPGGYYSLLKITSTNSRSRTRPSMVAVKVIILSRAEAAAHEWP